MEARKGLTLVALGVALIAVLGVTAATLRHLGSSKNTIGSSTSTANLGNSSAPPGGVSTVPTNTVPPTAIPTATTVPSSTTQAGWTAGKPVGASGITFASSTPSVAYACGGGRVWRSSDGARTWTVNVATILPNPADQCQIIIDPSNTSDVVAIYQSGPAPPITLLWRSRDGGQSWSQLTIPVSGAIFTTNVVFAGTTVAALVQVANNTSTVALMAPANDTFTTVAPATVLGATYAGNYLERIVAQGKTIVGQINISGTSNYSTAMTMSLDDGATWTQQTLANNGLPLLLQAIGPDGRSLYAGYFTTDGPQPANLPSPMPLLRSANLGQSWQELPAVSAFDFVPHGYPSSFVPIILRDGTIFVLANGTGQVALFRLLPGAAKWTQLAASYPGAIITVQVDATGRALTIWAHAGAGPGVSPEVYPSGLQVLPLA